MRSPLERLADVIVRTPGGVVLLAVGVALMLSAPATATRLASGNDAFAPDTPELLALQDEQELFADANALPVQVVVEGDVLSADGLATVATLEQAVRDAVDPRELADGMQPAFVSWLTPVQVALQVEGGDPSLLTDDEVAGIRDAALDRVPPTVAARLEGLLARDDDGTATAGLLVVGLDRDAIAGDAEFPVEELTAAAQQVSDAVAAADVPLATSTFSFELLVSPDADFQAEVARLFGLAFAIIALVLLAVFRQAGAGRMRSRRPLRRAAGDTALALGVALMAIGVQQGVGVLLGPDVLDLIGYFSPPTQIVPILLVALGVDYAIHLQERYRDVLPDVGVDQATRTAVLGVGPALALASATTAIGFLTNLLSPTPAIRDLGVLAAVGLVAAFLLAVTVFPAARLLLDRRAVTRGVLSPADGGDEDSADDHVDVLSRLAGRAAEPALTRPWTMLAVTAVLAAGGGFGLSQLETSYDFADFVPADSPVKIAYDTLQEQFGGGVGETTSVLVRGDVADPRVHDALLDAEDRLVEVDGVAQVEVDGEPVALVDGLRGVLGPALQLAQAGPAAAQDPATAAVLGDPATYAALGEAALADGIDPTTLRFPADADVTATYGALAAAAPGVVALDATGRPVAVRLVATTPVPTDRIQGLRADVREAAEPVVAATADVDVVSQAIVSDVSVTLLNRSQFTSILTTVVAVLLLLTLVYGVRDRRPLLGALMIVPVVVTALLTFGVMWLAGIDFDPATSTIAALVIGVGIDYVIHVGERFSQELRAGRATRPALEATLQRTGGALTGSGVTTTVGFAVLLTASLPPFQRLGFIIVLAIGLSLLTSLLVAPPLLVLWARMRDRAEEGPAPVVDHDEAMREAARVVPPLPWEVEDEAVEPDPLPQPLRARPGPRVPVATPTAAPADVPTDEPGPEPDDDDVIPTDEVAPTVAPTGPDDEPAPFVLSARPGEPVVPVGGRHEVVDDDRTLAEAADDHVAAIEAREATAAAAVESEAAAAAAAAPASQRGRTTTGPPTSPVVARRTRRGESGRRRSPSRRRDVMDDATPAAPVAPVVDAEHEPEPWTPPATPDEPTPAATSAPRVVRRSHVPATSPAPDEHDAPDEPGAPEESRARPVAGRGQDPSLAVEAAAAAADAVRSTARVVRRVVERRRDAGRSSPQPRRGTPGPATAGRGDRPGDRPTPATGTPTPPREPTPEPPAEPTPATGTPAPAPEPAPAPSDDEGHPRVVRLRRLPDGRIEQAPPPTPGAERRREVRTVRRIKRPRLDKVASLETDDGRRVVRPKKPRPHPEDQS